MNLTERKIEEAIDAMVCPGVAAVISKDKKADVVKHLIQYVKEADAFRPCGHIELVPKLDPHAYILEYRGGTLYFVKKEFRTDDLYLFEGSKMYSVLEEIERFWTLKGNFDKLGFLHNRGLLLYGPPGTGKTCLIKQVAESMTKQGDLIIIARALGEVLEGLPAFREVEPDRRVVVVFEDMDEYIGYSERNMLQLLDGNNSVDNVLFLGTTNYIEKFPPRLLRPGRFDKKVKIDYPPVEGRLIYLKHKLNGIETPERIQQIAEKTRGFSFGHLRELIIAGYAFKENVGDVIERLRSADYTDLPRRDEKVLESIRRK
jgi:hypothetical protein